MIFASSSSWKKRDSGGEGILTVFMPPLNNFSDLFFKKIEFLWLLKEIYFQSNLKQENNLKIKFENCSFPHFCNSIFLF